MVTSGGKLSELQRRVLDALAAVEPPFVLGGGGALTGFHLGHRTTRDLDLFWRNRTTLEDVPRLVEARLKHENFSVAVNQTSPAFVQLRVSDGSEAVIVDLVSESTDSLDAPIRCRVERKEILVDSARAILAEKLCALLERSELRDLVDVEALVRSGEDLTLAIADAPRRDQGFSPLTLAWVLRDWDVRHLGRTLDVAEADIDRLDEFRWSLIDKLVESVHQA